MPCMNGYELVKEIKILDPKVKVILMSAFEANEYDFEHNVTTIPSVDALITKPASIARVQEIVLETITKRSTTIKIL